MWPLSTTTHRFARDFPDDAKPEQPKDKSAGGKPEAKGKDGDKPKPEADKPAAGKDGTPDAAGETDDAARTVADRRNAMQGSLDTRAVVTAKVADAARHQRKVFFGHLAIEQHAITAGQARFRASPKIEDDL